MGYILGEKNKQTQRTRRWSACLYAMFATLSRKFDKDGSSFPRHSELTEI